MKGSTKMLDLGVFMGKTGTGNMFQSPTHVTLGDLAEFIKTVVRSNGDWRNFLNGRADSGEVHKRDERPSASTDSERKRSKGVSSTDDCKVFLNECAHMKFEKKKCLHKLKLKHHPDKGGRRENFISLMKCADAGVFD